jgi:AraC-like DNA-binding protein
MDCPRSVSIRAHDDGIDRWEMAEAAPAAILHGRVGRYTSYWEANLSFTTRRELAATSAVLIYVLGDPLEITGADGRGIVLRAGEGFVAGIADSTSLSRGAGHQDGVQIALPLRSLAALAGMPPAELTNQAVPMRDLIGRAADDLGGALGEADGAGERFALLDRFLAVRLAAEDRSDREIGWAMRRLASAFGPASAVLAAEIGWSRKHFSRRFRAATGLAPDRFRRLVRFERFTAALAASPADSLAGLAFDHGYVDQSHLHREVLAFSAMTPGQLRARLIPNQGGVRDG